MRKAVGIALTAAALATGSIVAAPAAQAATCGYTVYAVRQPWKDGYTYSYDVHSLVNGGSASGCRTQIDVYYTLKGVDGARVKKSSSNSETHYSTPAPGYMADGGDAGRNGSGVYLLVNPQNGQRPSIIKPGTSYIRVYNGSTLLAQCTVSGVNLTTKFTCAG